MPPATLAELAARVDRARREVQTTGLGNAAHPEADVRVQVMLAHDKARAAYAKAMADYEYALDLEAKG